MTPVEVRAILGELDRRLSAELARFWHRLAETSTSEFRDLVIAAYPELVTPYVSAAADLGAVWYDSQPSTNPRFTATPSELPPVEKLQSSASWALAVGNGEQAIALLSGAAERALFDGLRDTVVDNATREPGARWARHASANACGFCRMLATRHVGENATFYSSEAAAGRVVGRGKEMSAADRRDRAAGRTRRSGDGVKGQFLAGGRRARGNADLGSKYHDNCHCVATMIRPGQTYSPPSYVERWNDEYIAASKESRDPNVIARLMDTHRH